MKTKSSLLIAVAFAALFLAPASASALVNSVLYVQGPGGSVVVNTNLAIPETCTVQDSVGASHVFTGYKAICALQVAKDTGVITGFQVTDKGWGFSLDSVNGIVNAPGWVELWQLWQNGSLAEVGIQGIVLSEGDDFQLTYGPWVTNIVAAPQAAPGGSVVTDIYPKRVRVEDAVSFLVANQQENGSWGHPLFTDWVAVALGAYKGNSASAFYAENKLVSWLKHNQISAESPLTDFERRAMALMALGINPSTGTSTDYIQRILQGFDGTQFGDVNLVNDDIFAALVLLRVGYRDTEEPIASALRFVLDWQKESGSWGDADMTAAAIQLLDLVSPAKERDEALAKAIQYLEEKQEVTGGFGNVYSTSWVLQAIAARQGNGDSWIIDDRTPEHFLALRQGLDGGLLSIESKENRIWATAYAIPAVLGKPWGSVLTAFEKPSALLAQESSLFAPAVQNNNEAVENIKRQVTILEQEVAVLQKLEHIQVELDRIALEVRAVGVRVVAFRVQQLAQNVEQPKASSLAQAPESLPLAQDLSGITLSQESTTAPLTAEAKEAVGAQGLSPQLIILLVMIGGAIFVFSGGVNNALSLLRRTLSRV